MDGDNPSSTLFSRVSELNSTAVMTLMKIHDLFPISLSKLTLWLDGGWEPEREAKDAFLAWLPSLDMVSLTVKGKHGGGNWTVGQESLLLATLRNLHRLQAVHLEGPHSLDDVMEALADLPLLQHLCCMEDQSHSSFYWVEEDRPRVLPMFPSLRSMKLSGARAPGLSRLLRNIASPNFAVFSFGTLLKADVPDLLRTLGERETMKEVRIVDIASQLQYNDLVPISRCAGLERLEVVVPQLALTDEEVRSIVRHLPALKHLTLNAACSPRQTIQVLGIVSSECPVIETMNMNIFASAEHTPKDPPARLHRTLRDVTTRLWGFDDPKAVALYVCRLSAVPEFEFAATMPVGQWSTKTTASLKELEEWLPVLLKMRDWGMRNTGDTKCF